MSDKTKNYEAEVVVIGAGPGGYVAAIRAADLGKKVVVIEERERPGGVCLIEGCIPSKALIHAAEVKNAFKNGKRMGLTVEGIHLDLPRLRKHVETVVGSLTKGVSMLFKNRGITVIQGRARFKNNHTLTLENTTNIETVTFEHCIIATGSTARRLPNTDLPLWSAREALQLPEIPEKLLVVGGGYIGLELGFVYAGLGSQVTLVEFLPHLLAAADQDLVQYVQRNAKRQFKSLRLEAKVEHVEQLDTGNFKVLINQKGKEIEEEFDQVLVAIGRSPNTQDLGLENTQIQLTSNGLLQVDQNLRTAEKHIFAIGDIVPGMQLAHKASKEAKIAAETIAGLSPDTSSAQIVPAVVFTDPELAWVGLTETEARQQDLSITVGQFPLQALGRAKTMLRSDGFAKIIADANDHRILGVGIVGPHASDLIGEATLALKMNATLHDLAHTIHPHPTLTELLMEASEDALDEAIHLMKKL